MEKQAAPTPDDYGQAPAQQQPNAYQQPAPQQGQQYYAGAAPAPVQQQPGAYGQPQQPVYQPQQQQPVGQVVTPVAAGPGAVYQTPGVIVATEGPGTLYEEDPEKYRTCGIVTSLVFIILVLFGNLIGLASNMIRFESDTNPDFKGQISHYDAKFSVGPTVILDARIDKWDDGRCPPLGRMVKNYEWSSAMMIMSLLLTIPVIILQILRFCRKLRHRKLWTILTGTLSIVNVVIMLISYGMIYNSTQDHLQELNAWLLVQAQIGHVKAMGSGGFVAVILFSYVCSIVVFAFGIRTCAGSRCKTGCCCEFCTCNLAEDDTFKGCARSAMNSSPGPSGHQADPEYGSHAL